MQRHAKISGISNTEHTQPCRHLGFLLGLQSCLARGASWHPLLEQGPQRAGRVGVGSPQGQPSAGQTECL